MFHSFARLVDLQRLKNVKVDPMSVTVGHPCSRGLHKERYCRIGIISELKYI